MQNLLVIMVAEGNVFDLYGMIFKRDRLRGVFLLLSLEDLIDLADRRSDLRERIDKVEHRHDRRRHAE